MKYLFSLSSGEDVFDRHSSHCKVPSFLLEKVGQQVNGNGRPFLIETVEFPSPVGTTICVPTEEGDEVFFAIRKGRKGHTRFVKGLSPVPTNLVTLILKRDVSENYYVLITAWIGGKSEPEPWDSQATDVSRKHWNSHALIWESNQEEIEPGTIVKDCPW